MDTNVHTFFNTTSNYLHQSFGIRIRAEIIRELIGHPVGKKIIDVGCGNGVISNQFLDKNHITFLDLSENMIKHVRDGIDSKFEGNAKYLVGSFTDLEIADVYDYIFAIGLLAHVPSVSACLSRMNSILFPEGSVIIQFSDFDQWLTRLNIRKATSYGYPINHLSYGVMTDLVAKHGFGIEKEIRFSFLLPGMGKLPDSFLYRYSRLVWRSKILSRMGTDIIWLLKKKKSK
ncbi:MAG: class I SAM-dependent methyltransferase [Cyclobacteriaceae bacterium]|nr:class I SAM-dependent methyltransferase [Cyclobacteriaceae bacterium]